MFKIVAYVFLALYTLAIFVPFYVIIVTSLTTFEELMSRLEFIWIPEQWSLEAYRTVLLDDRLAINGVSSLLRGFFNTLWMTVPYHAGGAVRVGAGGVRVFQTAL